MRFNGAAAKGAEAAGAKSPFRGIELKLRYEIVAVLVVMVWGAGQVNSEVSLLCKLHAGGLWERAMNSPYPPRGERCVTT